MSNGYETSRFFVSRDMTIFLLLHNTASGDLLSKPNEYYRNWLDNKKQKEVMCH